MKHALFVTALIVGLLLCSEALANVTLRHSAEVEGEKIRLSDLFSGIEESADRPVAMAPKPGDDVVFNADVLSLLAKRYNIDWRPLSTRQSILVSRASKAITAPAIEKAIKAELTKKGNRVEVVLDNPLSVIHLNPNASGDIQIKNLKQDRQGDRFTALVMAGSETLNVTGRAFDLIAVPVLKDRIDSTGIISARDLSSIDLRRSSIAKNIILDPKALVGMSPRRVIMPGEPVREDEIATPLLVEKGQVMVVLLQNSAMTLTIRAKAMQNGGKGDVIRAINTTTNRPLEVEITGTGTGIIRSAENFALNLQADL